jgi:hypothetical protein
MEKTYFEETQHFQWGFIVGISLIALLFAILFLVQVIFKVKIGSRPAPSGLLLVLFVFTAGFAVFLGLQKLKVKISSKAVYYSFGALAPLQSIPKADIASIKLRKYDGMDEFSGWGEKSNAKEDSYTTSGDEGIEIKFKNSAQKSILIGTHSAKQVQQVLSTYYAVLGN